VAGAGFFAPWPSRAAGWPCAGQRESRGLKISLRRINKGDAGFLRRTGGAKKAVPLAPQSGFPPGRNGPPKGRAGRPKGRTRNPPPRAPRTHKFKNLHVFNLFCTMRRAPPLHHKALLFPHLQWVLKILRQNRVGNKSNRATGLQNPLIFRSEGTVNMRNPRCETPPQRGFYSTKTGSSAREHR